MAPLTNFARCVFPTGHTIIIVLRPSAFSHHRTPRARRHRVPRLDSILFSAVWGMCFILFVFLLLVFLFFGFGPCFLQRPDSYVGLYLAISGIPPALDVSSSSGYPSALVAVEEGGLLLWLVSVPDCCYWSFSSSSHRPRFVGGACCVRWVVFPHRRECWF